MRSCTLFLPAAIAGLAVLLAACGESETTGPTSSGTIVIDTAPNAIAAPWQVSGPGGYSRSGAGDLTLDDVTSGTCTATWQDVAGWTAPAAVTLEVPADSTVTITGAYVREGMTFPDTADKLMANFQAAYIAMDAAAYAEMLHPDYFMILQQNTSDDFPDVGTTLDVAEEQRIHTRMFSGLNVTDPQGMLVPGVEAIEFQAFTRQGAWGVSLPGDQIPNTEYAVYDALILLDRGQMYSTLKTQGTLKVYVAHQDSTANGVTRPCYRLRGMMDLTGDNKEADSETSAWGSVKALFR